MENMEGGGRFGETKKKAGDKNIFHGLKKNNKKTSKKKTISPKKDHKSKKKSLMVFLKKRRWSFMVFLMVFF